MPEGEYLYVRAQEECLEIDLAVVLVETAHQDSDDVLLLLVLVPQLPEELLVQQRTDVVSLQLQRLDEQLRGEVELVTQLEKEPQQLNLPPLDENLIQVSQVELYLRV
jgi:hypothetical protein